MQRRYNLAYFILASVVVLSLTPLMVCVDAQAQIAFAFDRDGNFEIYVMDTDGKKPQRLTNNLFPDEDPSWSPDGKRIVFTSMRDMSAEIYVMDADGPMVGILKTSLTIPFLTGDPHGHLTVNALPLCLIGMGTLKST